VCLLEELVYVGCVSEAFGSSTHLYHAHVLLDCCMHLALVTIDTTLMTTGNGFGHKHAQEKE